MNTNRAPMPRMSFVVAATLLLLGSLSIFGSAASPRFFDDDPIRVERDTQDASGISRTEINLFVDLTRHMLTHAPATNRGRAKNLNSVEEVPDSSWFTNRIGTIPLTAHEVANGTHTSEGPASGTWTIIGSKTDGITPGFLIRDSAGERWFLKFDPSGYRGMTTGTEVTVTKLMWALGYHVPENHIAYFRREQLALGASARFTQAGSKPRAMRLGDIEALLDGVDRERDGSYRVVASRALPGKPVGRIRFAGTRPDDPNDIVPHEDRRELRGYGVFAAWLNHVDAKATNSLDTLIEDEGRSYVRHHLIDFGSALGSGGVAPADYWAGSEYLLEPREVGKQMLGFGFYRPKWHAMPFYEARAIGRMPMNNGDFNPDAWKPRVPNPAFLNARDDDKFWAAQKLAAMTTNLIRAAVRSGEFGDAESEEFLVRALAQRRDAIVRAYLTAINPVSDPALDADGRLSFRNAAVDADVAKAPREYRVVWSSFDNATGIATRIGESSTRATTLQMHGLPRSDGSFVKVEVSAMGGATPTWEVPVSAYFRLRHGDWRLVGFERMPE